MIGVGWEIFERGLGESEGYLLDTFIDVISDTIGNRVVCSDANAHKH